MIDKKKKSLLVIAAVAVGLLILFIAAILFLAVFSDGFSASKKASRKLTQGDMRTIGVAVESWSIDWSKGKPVYPRATTLDELARQLEPAYVAKMPSQDGWGRPLRYEHAVRNDGSESYYIGSAGKDGKWEHEHLSDYQSGPLVSLDSDIVFSGYRFITYPKEIDQ